MKHSLLDDLNDPDLFQDEGSYEYSYNKENESKSARGSLHFSDEVKRDPKAQSEAGGSERIKNDEEWGNDDGGHLIGNRFGGSSEENNLFPQNSNLNRSAYKKLENEWADHLNRGDKVYVNIETAQGERPDSMMGYYIVEKPDGSRQFETFSYENMSGSMNEKLEKEAEEFSDSQDDGDKTSEDENMRRYVDAEYVPDDEYKDYVDDMHKATDYDHADEGTKKKIDQWINENGDKRPMSQKDSDQKESYDKEKEQIRNELKDEYHYNDLSPEKQQQFNKIFDDHYKDRRDQSDSGDNNDDDDDPEQKVLVKKLR